MRRCAASMATCRPARRTAVREIRKAQRLAPRRRIMRAHSPAARRAALSSSPLPISAGAGPSIEVTAALSTDFADARINAAVDWLLLDASAAGQLLQSILPSRGKAPAMSFSPWASIGAGELNYLERHRPHRLLRSGAARLAPGTEPATFFVRLTKRLVGLLQEVTEDGYVFRVDLRLRPDPRATQIAISIEAAAIYYESMGQNWERAAMIKARPVAGDMALGEEFLDRLAPLCLAQISRFRRHRRRAIAEAPDPRRQGPWRDRGPGPQHQARPRRHPRDRVLRADPAADRRRPQSAAARTRAPSTCSTRWPTPAGSRRKRRRSRRRPIASCATSSTASRWSTTSRPILFPADDRGLRPPGALCRLRRSPADFEARLCADLRDACRGIMPPVRGCADTRHRDGQPGLHRRRGRSRDPRAPCSAMGFRQASEVVGDDPRLAFRPLCGDAQRPRQGDC